MEELMNMGKMQRKELIHHGIIRFFEFLISELVISLIVSAMAYFSIVSTVNSVWILIGIGLAIFEIFTIQRCLYSFWTLSDVKLYLLSNGGAYLAFMLLSIIIYKLIPVDIYSWMFMPMKLANFLLGWTKGISLLSEHCIGIAIILLVTLLVNTAPYKMTHQALDDITIDDTYM